MPQTEPGAAQPCGRPDTPTELLKVLDSDAARVRQAAFRRLVATVAPVDVATLAVDTDLTPDQVESSLADLAVSGAVARHPAGPVVAAGGLSAIPSRHQLRLDGRQFWTWCAFDGIGIPAALNVDAALDTRCPHCGQPIQVAMEGGRPPADLPITGWLPGGPCGNVQADFCPDANLFCNDMHLVTWRTAAGDPPGAAATLPELADTGRMVWADLT